MVSLTKKNDNAKLSFLQLLRPTFVIFFLYLLGDAIYRWEGFKYYASISEFIPSLSLVTILWGIVAVLFAFILWVPIRLTEWLCRYKRISSLPLLTVIYAIYLFVFMTIIALSFKVIFWGSATRVSFAIKLLVLLIAGIMAVVTAFLIRNRISTINERITPLVWMFGIWVMFSIPIVAYQYIKHPEVEIEASKDAQYSIPDTIRPNIILVTFDALRARDMSVYGYHLGTTPFISTWARSASIFTRLEASSTFTTPTTASLMTGKRVWTHQTFHNEGSTPDKSYNESLPSVLKKNGYYTSAFIGAKPATVNQLGIAHDFDLAPFETDFMTPSSLRGHINKLLYKVCSRYFKMYNWILKSDFVVSNVFKQITKVTKSEYSGTFERFLLSVDSQKEPFFTWIHLHEPHDPYLPPEPFIGMFDASPELKTKADQGKLLDGQGNLTITEATQRTVNTLRARYNENIRYCDYEFENFIKGLSARNLLSNTIIILSSDHGESFEHNILGHGCLDLFEEVTNIPLIIKVPGNNESRVINNIVEQIDIPASILDFAGIEVPSWMEGRSFRPMINGDNPAPEPVFSMAVFNNKSGQKISKGTLAVWQGNYKFIHYLHESKSLLFNLQDDPYEMSDLFNKEPEVSEYLLNLVQDKLKKANDSIALSNNALQ